LTERREWNLGLGRSNELLMMRKEFDSSSWIVLCFLFTDCLEERMSSRLGFGGIYWRGWCREESTEFGWLFAPWTTNSSCLLHPWSPSDQSLPQIAEWWGKDSGSNNALYLLPTPRLNRTLGPKELCPSGWSQDPKIIYSLPPILSTSTVELGRKARVDGPHICTMTNDKLFLFVSNREIRLFWQSYTPLLERST